MGVALPSMILSFAPSNGCWAHVLFLHLSCLSRSGVRSVFYSAESYEAPVLGGIIHTVMREVAPLVRRFIGELDAVEGDVIDIACGGGQNG